MPIRKWAPLAASLLWFGLTGCGSGTAAADERVAVDLSARPELYVGEYRMGERTITFARSGNPAGPLVLFVHGSPGNWKAFEHLMSDPELGRAALMISVDRPGFGGSGFGAAEPSLEKQAACLRPLLERSGGGKAILVGHSLGGSLIARMAMDFPERVGGLVLVAPAIDPSLEELRWYNRLASLSPVRLLLPQSLDISNQEILPLRGELEKMLPLWDRITSDVIVIQGDKDNLVSPKNADFAARVLTNANVVLRRIPDGGHFVLWERPDLIRDAVLGLLKRPELAGGSGSSPRR